MIVKDPAHEVILGGLPLMLGGEAVDYPDGFRLQVVGDDATWGNPESVVTTLYSMLSAGSLLHRDGDDNRAPAFQVVVSAPMDDGLALAKGEAALKGVSDRPVVLEWLPPQTGAVRAVFDVVDSKLEHVMDDVDELRVLRTWRITMSALPHARSAELTVAPAVAAAAAVVVNNGSTDAGWSTSPGDTVSSTGGAIVSTYDPSFSSDGVYYGTHLKLTASVDVSTTKYLAVDWKTSIPSIHALSVQFLVNLAEVRRDPLAGGYVRSYYRVPDSMSELTYLSFGIIHPSNTGTATLSIDQVQRMQALPLIGTARQQLSTIAVGGTAPTYGNIEIQHESADLGDVILYTYPAELGYTPALSPWLSAGALASRTPDAEQVSGGFNNISTAIWALVPASSIPPGEYAIVARVYNQSPTADVGILYDAKSWQGNDIVGAVQSGRGIFTLPGDEWRTITLGTVNLPPSRVGASGAIQIEIVRDPTATQSIIMDEFWIFNTAGRLTVVEAASSKRVQISAPSLNDKNGAVMIGDQPDWSDSYSASHLCSSRQHHDLAPGVHNAFLVTTTAQNAALSSSHYQRWHTHPTD